MTADLTFLAVEYGEEGITITARDRADQPVTLKMGLGGARPGDELTLEVVWRAPDAIPGGVILHARDNVTGRTRAIVLEGADPDELLARTRLLPAGYRVRATGYVDESDDAAEPLRLASRLWDAALGAAQARGISRELIGGSVWRNVATVGSMEDEPDMAGIEFDVYTLGRLSPETVVGAVVQAVPGSGASWSDLPGRYCAERILANLRADAEGGRS